MYSMIDQESGDVNMILEHSILICHTQTMPPKQRIAPGPVGTTVAANVERLRQARGLSYVEVSRRMKQLGRPIAALGLTRIRDLQRRVDVDDLVNLAHALDVNPVDLLRPASEDSGEQSEWTPPSSDVQQTLEWLKTPEVHRGEAPPFPPNARIGPVRLTVRVRHNAPPIEIDLVPVLEHLDATQSEEGDIDGDD
ncbi:helix-turn-helix domain-containing protein [Rhodococcus aetherivorans]|uniref:Helix-turn-helix domain-containing protein n=1 Tax=Rhodococcus aetherivorans TaxID=191292 RepID=A0AA46PL99_9NOCA|nr:helix-turn-helix transcriptional regulator [Rhodococcus aetherivorans]UYF96594.1 helix-turn-helix domain-containing protein [Rhodococcus aetherivorans]